MKQQNIFSSFLKELGVKFTSYADKAYESHPYKNTLYGISDLLTKYNIENNGIRVNQSDLFEMDIPFIVYINNDFAIVKEVSQREVKYILDGKKYTISIEEFFISWSGIALIANINNKSIEPNYKEHLQKDLLQKSKNISLIILSFTFILFTVQFPTTKKLLFIVLNIIGLYISYLLLLKQNNIKSSLADHMCSLFNQSTCNTVLETSGAKILSFSWSELGFSYFIANLLLALYFPNLFVFAIWINIMILPYSFWSIWYQYKIVHQWCILCLIVQVILWSIFIVNILTKSIEIPNLTINWILMVVVIYGICILLTHMISNKIQEKNKLEHTLQKCNNIKLNENVFKTLLLKQQYFNVDKYTSNIIWGNIKATNIITILTNPHCTPCANMHKRIKSIMKELNEKVCIQYIFSSFNEELSISSRFLIATYLQKNRSEAETIYDEWFKWGRFHFQSFMNKYSVVLDDQQVDTEIKKHESWKNNNNLNKTPTILFNGYILPEQYEIEDIIYLTNL